MAVAFPGKRVSLGSASCFAAVMHRPTSARRAGKLAFAGIFIAAGGRPARPTSNGDSVASTVDGDRRRRIALVARRGPDRPAGGRVAGLLGRRGPNRLRLARPRRTVAAASLRRVVHRRRRLRAALARPGDSGAADDSASRLSGRYEYRRYRWRDLWTSGFDVGVGVEGSGEHLTFDRHFEPDIEVRRTMNNARTAIVLAARWQRSERWGLQAAWGNGVTFGRSIHAVSVGHRGHQATVGRRAGRAPWRSAATCAWPRKPG